MFPTDSEGISRHFDRARGNLAIHPLISFTFIQVFPLYFLSDAWSGINADGLTLLISIFSSSSQYPGSFSPPPHYTCSLSPQHPHIHRHTHSFFILSLSYTHTPSCLGIWRCDWGWFVIRWKTSIIPKLPPSFSLLERGCWRRGQGPGLVTCDGEICADGSCLYKDLDWRCTLRSLGWPQRSLTREWTGKDGAERTSKRASSVTGTQGKHFFWKNCLPLFLLCVCECIGTRWSSHLDRYFWI